MVIVALFPVEMIPEFDLTTAERPPVVRLRGLLFGIPSPFDSGVVASGHNPGIGIYYY
jgi:hypothetical protein